MAMPIIAMRGAMHLIRKVLAGSECAITDLLTVLCLFYGNLAKNKLSELIRCENNHEV